MNLITNAAHALAERGADGRIEINAVRRDDRVRIAVKDNGPGIPRPFASACSSHSSRRSPLERGPGSGWPSRTD